MKDKIVMKWKFESGKHNEEEIKRLFTRLNEFWDEPLDKYLRKESYRDYGCIAAEAGIHSMGLPQEYNKTSEEDEMQKKVEELETLVKQLSKKLEEASQPLKYIADAIMKKARFVNVAAAYEFMQEMNSVFMDYKPWKDGVKALEDFLIKEKRRASLPPPPDYPTDEEMAEAIMSINGKGKPLNDLQKWMGVCCYAMYKCNYPKDIERCCNRLAALPYAKDLPFPCKYDNVRKLAVWGFYRETYDDWKYYRPKEKEKKIFHSCWDVASALETALNKIMGKDAYLFG